MVSTPRSTAKTRKGKDASITPTLKSKGPPPGLSKAAKEKREKKSARTSGPKRKAGAGPDSSSAGKGKSTKKRQDSEDLEEPTETEEEEEEDDDGSDFKGEQGSDESTVASAVGSDQNADDDDSADDDDDDDDEASSAKKRRKNGSGGGSASKKSKNGKGDDLNLRVIKQQKVIPGPKGNPETHIILPSTMDFLERLKQNNDREWFKARDAQYRHALKNVMTLCQAWVPRAAQADWSLPEMPVKDLMQRIHRDVRFSKSKIPYRTNLAFSHSRTGRKGPFAIYYLQISPGGDSLLAGGLWAPEAEQVKSIRNEVLRDASPLRKILNDPKFIKYFGKPDFKSGKRTSIYGHDDQLKSSPKMEGVTKDHPDIDLLKLRSNAVTHHFKDEEVVAENFLDKVIEVMEVMAPFVQLLNDWLVPPPPEDEDNEEDEDVDVEDDDEDLNNGPPNGDEEDDDDDEEEEEEEEEE